MKTKRRKTLGIYVLVSSVTLLLVLYGISEQYAESASPTANCAETNVFRASDQACYDLQGE
jgi:hypothetical protein